MEIVCVIGPPDRTTLAMLKPKGIPSEHLVENVIHVGAALWSLCTSKPIEILLLLGIGQDVVGALDLFEFFGVTRWFIRVKSKSEFAIGLLDLLFCGPLRNPKSLIRVHPNFSRELLL